MECHKDDVGFVLQKYVETCKETRISVRGDCMRNLIINEEGASVVEYGMIVGLLALVAFLALYKLGHIIYGALSLIFFNYLWW